MPRNSKALGKENNMKYSEAAEVLQDIRTMGVEAVEEKKAETALDKAIRALELLSVLDN